MASVALQEGAAAALGQGVASGQWGLADGASATATLALQQMVRTAHHQDQQHQQEMAHEDEEDDYRTATSGDIREALMRQPSAPAAPAEAPVTAAASGESEKEEEAPSDVAQSEGDERRQQLLLSELRPIPAGVDRGELLQILSTVHCCQYATAPG
jgi:hypothetical protein